ncbi:orf3 [Panicum miliaceum]|uniref:Orf3 n=1 Tax=Panicum miliaceum TaxID=4540 RepID=A0A3L6TCB1_PANMI|nr:orf3 [Panicum miliaceum]
MQGCFNQRQDVPGGLWSRRRSFLRLVPPWSSSPSGSASSSESDGDTRETIRILIREGAEARERYDAATRELDRVRAALEAAEIKWALDAAELETAAARIEAADAQGLAVGREEEVATLRAELERLQWRHADLEEQHDDLSRAAMTAVAATGSGGQLLPDHLRALPFCVRDLVIEGMRQEQKRQLATGFWEWGDDAAAENVIKSLLKEFLAKGFLPPKDVAGWRAPSPEHEEPHPEPYEVVSFLAFKERGLRYPAHWFFWGLLHEWRLELQHLNPNAVLHIAGFVTLCEAFLGIELHVGLFQGFFYGKTSPANGEMSSATPVGGFGLQRRPRYDDIYPEYTPAESNKGWHGDWFYIRNPPEAPFPEFHGGRPGMLTTEKTLVAALKEVIRESVVDAWNNGATVFFTMCERRMTPLSERRKSMWLYSGPSDPDRSFAEELPEDDVYYWLMMVLKGVDQEDFKALAPFDCGKPPNLARILPLERCFCLVVQSFV